ncbi:hypothetical protein Rs2_14098 [Raphanus sativus]|nr:hypothetical protein Rs2_14098 [Raphanus sativus]
MPSKHGSQFSTDFLREIDCVSGVLTSQRHVFFATTTMRIKIICFSDALSLERNPRLHTSKSRTSLLIVKECKVTLKAKLIGLDHALLPAISRRLQQSSAANESYLQLWFRYFDA